jgi:hypothetical protein
MPPFSAAPTCYGCGLIISYAVQAVLPNEFNILSPFAFEPVSNQAEPKTIRIGWRQTIQATQVQLRKRARPFTMDTQVATAIPLNSPRGVWV